MKGGERVYTRGCGTSTHDPTALARTALLGTFIQTFETRAEEIALFSQDWYIDLVKLVILRGSNVLVHEIQRSEPAPPERVCTLLFLALDSSCR